MKKYVSSSLAAGAMMAAVIATAAPAHAAWVSQSCTGTKVNSKYLTHTFSNGVVSRDAILDSWYNDSTNVACAKVWVLYPEQGPYTAANIYRINADGSKTRIARDAGYFEVHAGAVNVTVSSGVKLQFEGTSKLPDGTLFTARYTFTSH
ncbi:hypothetical protein LJR027_000143 [Terrabacter sp. LjRoot27]|jgi:hypothetical protein|uniref:hypothetical protein n=1 Tax=Terrabacter sp. LjRoot27 TaxID=3342306 RepID=UPI003ED0A311